MKKMSCKGIGKFLTGVVVGAGLGVLFAPKSGSETRADLKVKIDELITKAKDIDVDEVKEEVIKKSKEIKKELAELDSEKVKKIAKVKAKEIEKKAEDLYKYAVKKGTPVVQDLADDVRVKALEVLKEVETKLEK